MPGTTVPSFATGSVVITNASLPACLGYSGASKVSVVPPLAVFTEPSIPALLSIALVPTFRAFSFLFSFLKVTVSLTVALGMVNVKSVVSGLSVLRGSIRTVAT